MSVPITQGASLPCFPPPDAAGSSTITSSNMQTVVGSLSQQRKWKEDLYKSFLGTVISRTVRRPGGQQAEVLISSKGPSSEEKSFTFISPFSRYCLELQLRYSYGKISRTLNVSPVVDRFADIFSMCRAGDIAGIQTSLSQGKYSPFSVDEYGCGFLHVSRTAPLYIY